MNSDTKNGRRVRRVVLDQPSANKRKPKRASRFVVDVTAVSDLSGLEVIIDTQRYTFVRLDRKNGKTYLFWQTNCPTCGVSFELYTATRFDSYFTRRCAEHRIPGQYVGKYTPATGHVIYARLYGLWGGSFVKDHTMLTEQQRDLVLNRTGNGSIPIFASEPGAVLVVKYQVGDKFVFVDHTSGVQYDDEDEMESSIRESMEGLAND